MRGRKRLKLPEDYILHLYQRGYSIPMIAYILSKELDISVSRWTIWRRLRDMGVISATKSWGVCNEKVGVET
ncbi:hypothetical protein DRP04_10940 [Archaeoglobales archaeon]|nr:MAG: hypothetical protein DRP04_10940 [Archaeoglobales archaeon]